MLKTFCKVLLVILNFLSTLICHCMLTKKYITKHLRKWLVRDSNENHIDRMSRWFAETREN